jgi:hypothetical protein
MNNEGTRSSDLGGPTVDLVLLDWTRMGTYYCLAGATLQNGQLVVVRPLPVRQRDAPVRNVGWSAYQMDGHSRWQVFQLVAPEGASAQPPHCEDVWVRGLRPTRQVVPVAQRRAYLEATLTPAGREPFGAPLLATRTAAYLKPGTGCRSLASVVVPAAQVRFSALWRDGAAEPDYRVSLPVPGFDSRILPVKDHFLLSRAEQASADLDGRLAALNAAVRRLGEQVVVRLGLSRPYPPGREEAQCWLMADGFFSLDDPQP